MTVSCNSCFPGHNNSVVTAVEFQGSSPEMYEISQTNTFCLSLEVPHFSSLYISMCSVISCTLQERQEGWADPGVLTAQLLYLEIHASLCFGVLKIRVPSEMWNHQTIVISCCVWKGVAAENTESRSS